ncbi:hypothetical protein V5R04_07360 [Jonesiaceae bacterium BS-20]|uniref:AAA family ATPase n=1 Tax=Jonesiaceae bacterium BS-20 TaxID=3120821 RepID=A0AAU7DZR2_9MICO
MTVLAPVHTPSPAPLIPGAPLAHVLSNIFMGWPAIVVDSPPGAGKSTLIVQAASYLFRKTDLTMTIAVSTNAQGSSLAERLAEELANLADDEGLVPLVVAGGRMDTPATAFSVRPPKNLRTLASLRSSPAPCDLLILDEAYQMTWADFASAADLVAAANAESVGNSTGRPVQILAVGDPSQIGPVIAFDANAWSRMKDAPQMRAPEVLKRRPDTTVLGLPDTYRLGPVTTNVIAPLYPFSFGSRRVARHLAEFSGEISTVEVDELDNAYDLGTMRTVATLAADYIGTTLIEERNGEMVSRPITARDVAIVVSRNAQVSTLEAILVDLGLTLGEITVGTADRLQGGQWHCVVAVDPTLSGAESDHAMASGRLCVMTSRHMTHLTWVFDSGWEAVMASASNRRDAGQGTAVRLRLLDAGL